MRCTISHYECYSWSLGQILRSSETGRKITGDKRIRHLLGYHQEMGRRSAEELNHSFLSWLARADRDRPFFAFLNFYDVHGPYLPIREAQNRFAVCLPGQPTSDENRRYSPDEAAALRDVYEECLFGLDLRIGQLLDSLSVQGVLENTLVIITSDHGEHFGEHGMMDHGHDVYLPLLHVPLIILFPGHIPARSCVRQPVSLRDLPITVMDLIGLGEQSPFPGRSLAGWWDGGAAHGQVLSLPVLSETTRSPDWLPDWYPARKGPMQSVVLGEYHYIRNGDGREELYQYKVDPGEQNNLIHHPDHGTLVKRFHSALKQFDSSRHAR